MLKNSKIRTKTYSSDQGGGGKSTSGCPIDVPGVLHQKRSLFHQTAGDTNVVDAEEAATCKRDVPRRVKRKHTG